jgi:hypothetical protein
VQEAKQVGTETTLFTTASGVFIPDLTAIPVGLLYLSSFRESSLLLLVFPKPAALAFVPFDSLCYFVVLLMRIAFFIVVYNIGISVMHSHKGVLDLPSLCATSAAYAYLLAFVISNVAIFKGMLEPPSLNATAAADAYFITFAISNIAIFNIVKPKPTFPVLGHRTIPFCCSCH